MTRRRAHPCRRSPPARASRRCCRCCAACWRASRTSRFFLFYGNRSTGEILFREALEELKDRFLGRLSVFHVLSREEQDLPILNGRLDGDKVRPLLRLVVPAEAVDEVFVCGPAA